MGTSYMTGTPGGVIPEKFPEGNWWKIVRVVLDMIKLQRTCLRQIFVYIPSNTFQYELLIAALNSISKGV